MFSCNSEDIHGGKQGNDGAAEPELRERLDGLAKAQRRSRSFIAAEAIRQHIAVNEWQIEEITKGMAEADRREFASDEQVRRTISKWSGRKRTRRAA